MGLAHAIKVSLGLFFAPIDLAGSRLGAVTLTETLRLDNARASFRPTVTTFVFKILVDRLICGSNDGCLRSGKLGARRHGQNAEGFERRRKKRVCCSGVERSRRGA
jgi:hypothetical protein